MAGVRSMLKLHYCFAPYWFSRSKSFLLYSETVSQLLLVLRLYVYVLIVLNVVLICIRTELCVSELWTNIFHKTLKSSRIRKTKIWCKHKKYIMYYNTLHVCNTPLTHVLYLPTIWVTTVTLRCFHKTNLEKQVSILFVN